MIRIPIKIMRAVILRWNAKLSKNGKIIANISGKYKFNFYLKGENKIENRFELKTQRGF